jgi:hypothetical protein
MANGPQGLCSPAFRMANRPCCNAGGFGRIINRTVRVIFYTRTNPRLLIIKHILKNEPNFNVQISLKRRKTHEMHGKNEPNGVKRCVIKLIR